MLIVLKLIITTYKFVYLTAHNNTTAGGAMCIIIFIVLAVPHNIYLML